MLTKYEERLHKIEKEIYELGRRVIEANKVIMHGLEKRDYKIFEGSSTILKNVDHSASEIDNEVVTVMALFTPEARDLREMVASLKITNEIVRAAANTRRFIKNFPEQAERIECDFICEYAVPLQKASIGAFEYAIEMIVNEDKETVQNLFAQVNIEEEKADDLYSVIEKNIHSKMVTNKELSREYFEILSSIRKLEKISDRAVGIAHLELYARIGGELK